MFKKLILVIVFVVFVSGCASLSEPFKKMAGLSVAEFRRGKRSKQIKDLPSGYSECFDQSLAALKSKGIVIHMQSKQKGYIIVRKLPGSIDTTKAGIFFTELEANQTRVEVISASHNAMEAAAEIAFLKRE